VVSTETALRRGEAEGLAAVVKSFAGSIPAGALPALAAGRAAALAGEVDHSKVNDPKDAGQQVRSAQARMREEALERFLTDRRAACIAGLESLDPADQHPLALQGWLDDPDRSTLLLVGGTGTGKTQAASAVGSHAAQFGAMMRRRGGPPHLRPLLVRGGPVNEYLRRLRPEGSPDPVWKVRDEARAAELWVGDDLGAEVDGELSRFAKEEMADLLDYRLDACLRQVYTTNLSAEELEVAVGDRMWSRLQEEATVVKFTGRDRRVRRKLSW
jgi:hypothetical protein